MCNLGHVNLAAHLTHDCNLDEPKLRESVRTLVRMLDNVVDLNVEALETVGVDRVKHAIRGNRRLGLGFMGLADMFYKMGVRYGSVEARKLCDNIMSIVQDTAEEYSQTLGEERGSFPNIEHSVFAKSEKPRRNAALTSVAPTGTTALAFDVNNGIEPKFTLNYTRFVGVYPNVERITCIDRQFLDACARIGHAPDSPLVRAAMASGTASGVPEHLRTREYEEIVRVFCVTDDLSPEEHLRMQSAVQTRCDNAISKTVNFPNNATREHMSQVYLLAHETKCKGCTVYRDGSRMIQVLNKESKNEAASSSSDNDGDTNNDSGRYVCPDCSSANITHSEGCKSCADCYWSACDTPTRRS